MDDNLQVRGSQGFADFFRSNFTSKSTAKKTGGKTTALHGDKSHDSMHPKSSTRGESRRNSSAHSAASHKSSSAKSRTPSSKSSNKNSSSSSSSEDEDYTEHMSDHLMKNFKSRSQPEYNKSKQQLQETLDNIESKLKAVSMSFSNLTRDKQTTETELTKLDEKIQKFMRGDDHLSRMQLEADKVTNFVADERRRHINLDSSSEESDDSDALGYSGGEMVAQKRGSASICQENYGVDANNRMLTCPYQNVPSNLVMN